MVHQRLVRRVEATAGAMHFLVQTLPASVIACPAEAVETEKVSVSQVPIV